MEDTKKLIEKYKRELMELSKTAPRPERTERAAEEEPPKTPKIIGYVTEESGEFPAVFDKFITEAVENNDIETVSGAVTSETNDMPRGSNDFRNGSDVENETNTVEFPDDLFDIQSAGVREPSDDISDRELMSQGTGESISNFPVPAYSTIEEFEANNTGSGMLEFRVFTARQALPIEGALIIVTVRINGKDHEMYREVTNSSGETEMHILPAPSRELSQNADNKVQPYSLYDASVEKKGYTKVILRDIPIFDGVRSIQRVAMLPETSDGTSDGVASSEEIIEEKTEVPNAK